MKITSINRDEALRYLGYKDNINIDNLTSILDKCENELLKAIEPRFIYKFFPIRKINDTIQVENTSLVLTGFYFKSPKWLLWCYITFCYSLNGCR